MLLGKFSFLQIAKHWKMIQGHTGGKTMCKWHLHSVLRAKYNQNGYEAGFVLRSSIDFIVFGIFKDDTEPIVEV